MKKFSQTITAAFFSAVLLFAFHDSASAHVTVKPVQSITGSSETYTITVPTEKNIPTTKVALRIPKNVQFYSYQPVPGWTTEVIKNAHGQAQTVSWTAKESGIAPGAFQQFQFRALNPKQTGALAWNAYQTYKDGSIVEWTGKENGETPHAITNVVKSADTTRSVPHGDRGNQILSLTAIVLSAIAIALSVITLVALRKKKDKVSSDAK
ncbi:YcnI family protein [Sporolactobacillus terrae]|uniref:YncI copper-binding domain-containing protein n=1 Tax=Sporolactobacillus terrae TaxID=269673 RepID=A0A410DB90_9BACL|nr:DUF1775 domain-containing protein [Sporolactobacillus terrae]QAA23394.1 hypothetical protein C0674_12730 [Sporolactobacillus terrae]QAA26365.1 hypothetical protein C0679_12715 [Sporolactobacillus terrae]UAK15460.1 DUF1775 domain-containing protein [Sporolactobacillus terrae]BBN99825.1 hypothetical protein St703_25300 [Sporolactobacillus terrae]